MSKLTLSLRDYSAINSDVPNAANYCRQIQNQIKNSNAIINLLFEEKTNKPPTVFSEMNNKFSTQQYVGVLAGRVEEKLAESATELKDISLSIGTRFDQAEKQFFLNYVFTKAFNINGRIFKDMDPYGHPDETWDLLLMIIFLNQLEAALKKGYYREYRHFEYNDSNIRGRIDIARHIKLNPQENGKVAYTSRELTVNNYMNLLLLYAYDELEKRYKATLHQIINQKPVLKKQLTILKSSIIDYGTEDIRVVLKETIKPIYHPYYHEYELLRKTSIMILRRLGLNIFDQNTNEVTGVLINMNNLWERFLYETILQHVEVPETLFATNKKEPIIFENEDSKGKRNLELDYYLPGKAVFDAKYKNAWSDNAHKKSWRDSMREDVFQVLSYMFALNVNIGGVIYPVGADKTGEKTKVRKHFVSKQRRQDYFYTIPYVIQDSQENYAQFEAAMDAQNEAIIDMINLLLK